MLVISSNPGPQPTQPSRPCFRLAMVITHEFGGFFRPFVACRAKKKFEFSKKKFDFSEILLENWCLYERSTVLEPKVGYECLKEPWMSKHR